MGDNYERTLYCILYRFHYYQILRESIKEEVASTAAGKVLEEKINETR